MKRSVLGWIAVCATAQVAWAQWESGSDGSDGAFAPGSSVEVDLGLAASLCDCDADTQVDDPCTWDCPSPVAGRGVYDAEQWAVVFKYTTVNVPAGVTITFGQHPSGAPVVWLGTGTATISGTVNINGEDGLNSQNPPSIPYYTRPGPGGFEGGQSGHTGAGSGTSFGLGPGSSPTNTPTQGGPAAHATLPTTCGTNGTGATYGSAGIVPLIGGSGGGQTPGWVGGGAGGGAILIAAPIQISVGSAGSITARGGHAADHTNLTSGPGSGGAIRLRADTVSLVSGSQLGAMGGGVCVNLAPSGPTGRIRIEAVTVNNNGTINGSQSIFNAPSVVFPAAPPQLYVTSACGQFAPADPEWSIKTTDIDVNSGSSCTVNIQGTGMPVGTIVVVRVIPARGNIISVNSTPLADAGGGLRTATASVTFPTGRSEIQLRANW